MVETDAQTDTDGLTASPALFVPEMSNLLAALAAGSGAPADWQARQLRAFFDIFTNKAR